MYAVPFAGARASHPWGGTYGRVAVSSSLRKVNAAWRSVPHISIDGRSEAQNAGRSGLPNNLQRSDSSSCTQGTPAGLPVGMPGMGEVMDGAMQQAPQPGRQEKEVSTMPHSLVVVLGNCGLAR